MLESGLYRVTVPEEAALLANTWLLQRGDADAAEALLGRLAPFFDRLRFYPREHKRPLRVARGVSLETAGETRARLVNRKPQADVLRMNEAIRIWAPLYDRAVALFLETVEGELPRLNSRAVEGGWPCRRFPDDFPARATANLDDYRRLRLRHRLCTKPERPKENFARLRRLLEIAAADPRRAAILLVGGNKVGDDQFYERMIPVADRIYDRHLQELAKEDLNDKDD